jgi:rod shape-determining protein MreC
MQQIINFLIRNKTFLLFLLLFSLSLFFTFQSHSYHKSKYINSANFLTGGIYQSMDNIGRYFSLKKENDILLEENNRLKSIFFNTKTNLLKRNNNDTILSTNYKFKSALVYKNSYSATNNYLTINKGERDNIKQDFGVIASKGIIGIIDNTSNKYARVMSILNTNSRINSELKKSNHFGTLTWNAKSPQLVQLIDIPKLAPVAIGDTIITGGRSTIFPKGILIGKIVSFKLDETENYYNIEVKLFNDMTSIGHVYIIENLDAKEISTLNNQNE